MTCEQSWRPAYFLEDFVVLGVTFEGFGIGVPVRGGVVGTPIERDPHTC